MDFRVTTKEDIPEILLIFADAQQSLKDLGVNQWQDGYPNEENILFDISNNESYVATQDGAVIGTVMLTFTGEPTYTEIDGVWLNQTLPYATIHRIAVRNKMKRNNVANDIFDACEQASKEQEMASLRVDTHKMNVPMRRFLEKNGFILCGEIILEDGHPRVAYEKII